MFEGTDISLCSRGVSGLTESELRKNILLNSLSEDDITDLVCIALIYGQVGFKKVIETFGMNLFHECIDIASVFIDKYIHIDEKVYSDEFYDFFFEYHLDKSKTNQLNSLKPLNINSLELNKTDLSIYTLIK